jgi:YbbR domain-containing protein
MRLFSNNFRLKLLAVLLSSTTWAVVVYADNPPDVVTLKSVAVDTGTVPSGLVVLRPATPVTVVLIGLRNNLRGLRREAVRASVDLTGAHRGHNTVRVNVVSPDPNISVRTDPDTIDVDLDRVGHVARKVAVRQQGSPDACCASGAPTTDPESVTLTGPATLLETAVAYVDLDITGRAADIQAQTLTVKVEAPGRKPLPQVTSEPNQVSASLPIRLNKLQKTVALQAQTAGQLPPGYRLVDIQLSPVTALVEGDPSALATLKVLLSDPIDLAGHTSDITVTSARFRLPPGVALVSSGPFSIRLVIQADARVEPTPSPTPRPSPSPTPSPSP